jgi:hypothetical protein
VLPDREDWAGLWAWTEDVKTKVKARAAKAASLRRVMACPFSRKGDVAGRPENVMGDVLSLGEGFVERFFG